MTGVLWLARKAVDGLLELGSGPAARVLPAALILGAMRPFVAAATALELVYAGPVFADYDRLPGSLRPLDGKPGLWRERSRLNLAMLVRYWSDRLAAPDWQRLCRFEGDRSSREAIESGARPVVLLTVHFGPFELLYYRLRACRVPVAILASVPEAQRPAHVRRMLLRSDRHTGLSGLPRLITTDALWDAADFLRGNRVLVVAATGGGGREFVVGEGDVGLTLSPGALKLAAVVDAVVIPCAVTAGRGGTMTVTLGAPVPAADLHDRRRHRAVCEGLLRFFLPHLRSAPGQALPWLLGRFRPASGTPAVAGAVEGG